jgi:hypothetical protein
MNSDLFVRFALIDWRSLGRPLLTLVSMYWLHAVELHDGM